MNRQQRRAAGRQSEKWNSLPYDPSNPVSIASDADREWFEDNAPRRIRLRCVTDGDQGAGSNNAILVLDYGRGIRSRIPLDVEQGSILHDFLSGRPHDDSDLIPVLRFVRASFTDSGDAKLQGTARAIQREFELF